MRLYVGNLPFASDEADFKSFLEEHGALPDELLWCTSHGTGEFRGFSFLTYYDETAALKALSVIDGLEFDGRTLRASEAIPRSRR